MTMLASSVRVRPCSSRARFSSLGRSTRSTPSSLMMRSSGERSRSSVPLGPLTATWLPATSTETPCGMGMARLPIRDICPPTSAGYRLPCVGQDFAAQLRLSGAGAGHDAVAGADDDHAQAAKNTRDIRLGGIDAQAGLADALHAADHRHLADVLQPEPELRG